MDCGVRCHGYIQWLPNSYLHDVHAAYTLYMHTLHGKNVNLWTGLLGELRMGVVNVELQNFEWSM